MDAEQKIGAGIYIGTGVLIGAFAIWCAPIILPLGIGLAVLGKLNEPRLVAKLPTNAPRTDERPTDVRTK